MSKMNITPSTGNSLVQQQRKSTNQNIQVYVRLRPLNARERSIRSAEVVEVVSPHEIVTRHSFDSKLTKKFTFDRTFGLASRQVEVYRTVVAPLIDQVLMGYNCTVFAYGQTGTGKTHTMVGTECAELRSSWEDNSDIGIIPRALCHLFDELRLLEVEFSMRISYLELYNEELCDLLSSDDNTRIRIFDDSTKKGSVIIQGLEEIPVHSKDDVYKLLEKGKERRKTATTLMNAQSSRSHTVFSILVHIRENGIDGEEMLKIGKLNLVDLAGSENASKAGNEKGIRVRETININQSLLTLGRVITALVDRTPHIPYRESKLTRLLQESLGGRTKTCIIATISPGHKDIEETLSTLEYAHRAKHIQNKPEINQKLTKKTVLKEYTEEIDKLKRDLIATRDKNGIYLAEETFSEMTLKMDSQHRELNEKMLLLKALKDELQNKEEIFNEVSLNLVEKTEKLKRTEQHLTQTKGALLQTKKVLNTTKRLYKEKKVLIESHVKTEQVLSNQAAQILEVADIATKETHQLHNTIERRKEIDRKIETACDQFASRMRDNFILMDENLDQLQEQHKSYAQLLSEELTSSTKVQNKLLSDAAVNIKQVNKLCDAAFSNTTVISEKYAKDICDLSVEHQTVLAKLFEELRNKEHDQKVLIQANLTKLLVNNKSQKSSLETMRKSFTEILQRNTSELEAQTSQVVQQIATLTQISESNIQKVEEMKKEFENQRALATQEQAAIDECVERMQRLKQQRLVSTEKMSELNTELAQASQQSIVQLNQNADCALSFAQTCRTNSDATQAQLLQQANAIDLYVDENVNKCSLLQTQVDQLCEQSSKQLDTFATLEQTHSDRMEQISTENVNDVKRLRLQHEKELNDACTHLKSGLVNEVQQLKEQTVVIGGFAKSLKNQIKVYGELYKVQMNNCVTEVNQFKQSELKTYDSTGSTPSKRDYSYPRVLASTSPHSQIVKRFRQENDYSDLDTTATIDEDSEGEEEQSVQEPSDSETIFNSTPIEAENVNRMPQSASRSANVLKPPPQLLVTGLLHPNRSPNKASPNKASPRRNSPMQAKENILP